MPARSTSAAGSMEVTSTSQGGVSADEWPWWWRQDVELPRWFRKKSKRRHPCVRFKPAYQVMVLILLHDAGFYLMYGSDIDPSSPQFIVFNVFLGIACLCILLTTIIDPGIVKPRMDLVMRDGGSHDYMSHQLVGIEDEAGNATDPDEQIIATEYSQSEPAIVREIAGIKHKWCYTCKIWRNTKEQTVHCSECGFCVAHYDHHCSVMGQCIARRNLRFFVGMYGACGAAGATLLVSAILRCIDLADQDRKWGDWTWYFALFGCGYGLTTFLPLSGVFLGYCQFSMAGLTNDSIADREALAGKHYSCRNLYSFWCQPIGPGFRRHGHPFGENRGYYCCQ